MKNPAFQSVPIETVPAFSVGIHVYDPPGLNVNFACEAAAVGNSSVLFLGALLWWTRELTKGFCQLASVLFKAWILQRGDKTSYLSQMHFVRVTFALV